LEEEKVKSERAIGMGGKGKKGKKGLDEHRDRRKRRQIEARQREDRIR